MECLVTQPNSVVLNIIVNLKAKGQECMDQVCQKLGIIEQDYFGLQYRCGRDENLWLNLRNQIASQLGCQSPPYRLLLKVKFFVPPYSILQPTTRSVFYDQVKADLDSGTLEIDNDEQIKIMSVLIAQAEYRDGDQQTHQLNQCKNLVTGTVEQAPQLMHDVVDSHDRLTGISREMAQYKLLQVAAGLENYGIQKYDALYDGQNACVGIGPKGVVLHDANMQLLEKMDYSVIIKANLVGKVCVLRVINEDGTKRDLTLKHASQSLANSMYRCITEMHLFFACDTINDDVSTQFSLDLKGTLASIFNEKTTLGREYVFDIKRTCREAHDHARRQLHQSVLVDENQSAVGVKQFRTNGSTISDDNGVTLQEKCQALEDTLDTIEESFTCCVCCDDEISAALCPCGHLACIQCANKLVSCPICRTKMETIQEIFLPKIRCKGASCASSISLRTVTSPAHRNCHKRKRKEDLDHRDCGES